MLVLSIMPTILNGYDFLTNPMDHNGNPVLGQEAGKKSEIVHPEDTQEHAIVQPSELQHLGSTALTEDHPQREKE
jgi:hypothetical protein